MWVCEEEEEGKEEGRSPTHIRVRGVVGIVDTRHVDDGLWQQASVLAQELGGRAEDLGDACACTSFLLLVNLFPI